MRQNLAAVLLTASSLFAKPKVDPTAEWLSEHYRLPEISGDISGNYDFYYTPYFLGVAAALDDPAVNEVDLMKASQIGWTYFLIGYIFKRIHDAAKGRQCPIMLLFAKQQDGKAFHDEKLVPSGQDNTCVDGLIDLTTSRKAGNSWWLKSFPNGFLKIVGSNSPGNVKSSSSVGLGVVEEPDDTNHNVKGQGTAIAGLEERVKRYAQSKLIVGGTPTIKGVSKTENRIEASDARVLPVKCHDCGEKHVLDWDNVDWQGKDGDAEVNQETGEIIADRHDIYGYSKPETAVYVCPHCQAEWSDYQRQKNIRDTVYEAIAEGDKYCGWVPTKPFYGKAGFKELNELYACIPGTTLADVVIEYLEAEEKAGKGDESGRIKFVNQKKGRSYEYKSDAPEVDALTSRCEDYQEMVVPVGAWKLTAGVDLQHNRIAIKIKGWGREEESWLVYAGEIYGDVTDKADPVWDELWHVLSSPIPHEKGIKLIVSAATIDTSDGTTSDNAYKFIKKYQHKGIKLMAGKGSSDDNGKREIFSKPKAIETKGQNDTKAAKHGLHVHMIGTHKAKDLIAGRMKLQGSGPGRMHWYKGVRADYFKQLTGAVKAPSRSGVLIWQDKAGQAVEFLDCEVYALHSARAIKLHVKPAEWWDELEKTLCQVDMFNNSIDAPAGSASMAEKMKALAAKLNG